MDYSSNLVKLFDVPFSMDYCLCAPRVAPNTPISLYGGHPQTGFINLLHSSQDKVLDIWEKQVRKGYVKKVQDIQLNGPIIEIIGQNPSTVFITTPIGLYQNLGIRLPVLVVVVKNLRKQFSFDTLILDDKNIRRRLRFTNLQSTTRVKASLTYIPIKLEDGWNILQIDLQNVTSKAFGTNYKETVRLQINGNCRLRRVGFTENEGYKPAPPDPNLSSEKKESLLTDIRASFAHGGAKSSKTNSKSSFKN